METSPRPIASIITVVYNAADGIADTIQSVVQFKTSDVEYIVIDGGSNDGTVDVIRRYERNIDYWHSERDAGIYDAINKGIRKCRGHFFYVLNVGDRLLQFPAQALRSAVESQADVATFAVQLANGRVHRSRIDYRSKFANTIHHQGAFYRLDLGIQYDTRFRIFSDFDQNQKLYKAGRRFVECQGIVCFHDLDGISNDPSKRGEYFAIVRLNFGPFWELIGRTYIAQGEFRQKLRKLLTGK